MEGALSARSSPMSPPERDLLMGLICEEKILQDRRTDGKVVLQKRAAWARITRLFNSHNLGPQRTEQQLKKVWERLKVKAKQEHAVKRREDMRTGGGAPPADLPKESDQVLTILGTDLHDIGNPFDLDAMPAMSKSHRQSLLIRFTKSLFVRANSYSEKTLAVCSVVAHPATNSVEEEVPASPQAKEPEEVPAPSPSTVRTRHCRNRAATSYKNTTATPELLEISREREITNNRFLEKREHLIDLQIKHMKVKIAEAEQREEEAIFRKEITKKELEKLNNS
ncbi:myb/SANT-like DNA-binding domain-containing protein 3 [Eriocheir sinensis]|uniref:myb/SANT-like DNA-binding domain-containing protein 3 n=1 Tax=Eriocheir sinensis TaxID=95602 RepID=UPI0021C845B3|nr:myb/SANT-like DNA-binding domain-containing protein 3 [Eriocheir sinensis]